jgi:hypothetical protein
MNLAYYDIPILDDPDLPNVIVIPCNCTGDIQHGLQEQAAKMFPSYEKHYVRQCEKKMISPGRPDWVLPKLGEKNDHRSELCVYNFPIRNRTEPTSYVLFATSLRMIAEEMEELDYFTSIGIPDLTNTIPWEDQEEMIINAFGMCKELEVRLYVPEREDSMPRQAEEIKTHATP